MNTELEPTFHYWVELPEAQIVRYSELPRLMAQAMHSDALAQAAAENNFTEALGEMVDAGTLKVLDPLTLGRHTFPIGEALRRAVLRPLEDVRPLLASFQIGLRLIRLGTGPTHWNIENAAAAIGAQQGFHQIAVDTLTQQMVAAACDGPLVVRHPHTGLPYRPEKAKSHFALVTPDDVNSWLDKGTFGHRWNPAGDAAPSAAPESSPAVLNKADEQHAPDFDKLATREKLIAAFGSFTGMEASWFRNLKDTPKLYAARKVDGQGGRGQIAVPWFCPYEVMQWQIAPKKKKGRDMSPTTGWRMLKAHFPAVYADHEREDPNAD